MQTETSQGTRISIINTGRMLADGGAMFGRIPRTLWRAKFAPDTDNNIELGTNAVLIERPDSRRLFDAGPGSNYTPQERAACGLLEDAAGRLPAQVDQLILSHLHFDHCGGIHDLEAREVLVSRNEWTAAEEPDELSVDSIRARDIAAIRPRLRQLETPGLIAPGLEIIFTPGHTAGHLSLLIDDEVLCVADLIPTAAHAPLDWIMAYDLYPLEVVRHKRLILAQAARRGWRVILPHEQFAPLVTVRAVENGFVCRPLAD